MGGKASNKAAEGQGEKGEQVQEIDPAAENKPKGADKGQEGEAECAKEEEVSTCITYIIW